MKSLIETGLKTTLKNALDKIGICLSAACVIHCLVLPIIFISFPALHLILGQWHSHFHNFLIYLIMPLSLLSFLPRFLEDRKLAYLYGPGMAIASIIIVIVLAENDLLPFHEIIEPLVTTICSLILIYFHWKNYLHRNSKKHNPDNCSICQATGKVETTELKYKKFIFKQ